MNLHVLAVGTARGKDLSKYQAGADFRKATRNMLLGYAALEPVLEKFPKLAQASFVLGSSYGEQETTKDFLKTLAIQGVARPLLFQSSLHNATLGFLALKLGMTGPSMTVSRRHLTGETTLEAASILIGVGSPLCLALTVESHAAELDSAMTLNYPQGSMVTESAGAILLAGEKFSREMGAQPLAVIRSIEYRTEAAGTPSGPYADSDALEKLANLITSSNRPTELRLAKPDRGLSVIQLEWPQT